MIYQFHYLYKTTNLINGKIYIGVHSTNNLNDGYLGSGSALTKAFKKYGKENFKKEILEWFDWRCEAFNREAEIVNKEFVKRNDVYNSMIGGLLNEIRCNYEHSIETKKMISDKAKKRFENKENHPMFGKINFGWFGKHHDEESKNKISNSNYGKIKSDETKRKISESKTGTIQSDEHKRKISESMKGAILTDEHKRKIGKANSISLKGRIPWNKGLKGVQIPWNKGLKNDNNTLL